MRERNCELISTLTRQLLAFSRKQVLLPQVISLETIIAEMDKMLRRLVGENIDLATIAQPEVGNVKADLNQIEQVLLNLAVNARDAMEGVVDAKLTIELRNTTLDAAYCLERDEVEPGDYVLLAISDNSSGMTPEVRARLFEPFFTTKGQGKGTGLGLATCHGIVRQSGGHIAVYSEVGRGTTFKVYLPRVYEDAPPIHHDGEAISFSAGTGTILLVEDQPMLRELGITVLQELGYDVLAAENGRHALSVFAENPGRIIDLLLTDVVMPEMGGKELAEKLRPISPRTKVIFCSGYTEDAIFHSGGLEAGVFFLQKPYTIAAVAQKLNEALASAA